MDDDATPDQRLLLDASKRFIEKECPLAAVRDRVFENEEYAAGYRHQAGELGWYSLLVPEEMGGGAVSGNRVIDAALVAYERGKRLQPDPFVGTNVVAYALAAEGTDEQRRDVLPALLAGEVGGSWAVVTAPGQPALGGAVEATTAPGGGFVLSGQSTFVQDPSGDGWFLICARAAVGPTQFLVRSKTRGLTINELDALDITRRFVEVSLDSVQLPASSVVGVPGTATDLIARQLALASVLTVAESVGAMDYELNMTVSYAKERIAFGRPIGSLQAVKHLLADTSLLLELSKAVAVAAARSVGSVDYDLEAASVAKALVGDCGTDLAQNCFQVFGGVGYTWGHDQHLYLRRLTTDAAMFGNPTWHRERLCQLSGI
jgi:alkylation response protein AidB-like acyl-CoA dehydrogenase